MNEVSNCLACNEFFFNTDTTKFIYLLCKRTQLSNPVLYMNDSIVENVIKFNFLGLILSSNLNQIFHLDLVSRKISREELIQSTEIIFFLNLLSSLYNTLILLHLSYCIFACGTMRQFLYSVYREKVYTLKQHHLAHTGGVFFRQLNCFRKLTCTSWESINCITI